MPTLVEENVIRLMSPAPRQFYVHVIWKAEKRISIEVLRIPCQTVHVFDSLEDANDWFLFDSSAMKGQPSTLGLTSVIKGWTDGIPLMSPGDTYRFWIPEELAYKDSPGRPQGMLVFEVELVEIKGAAPAPDAPHGHHP